MVPITTGAPAIGNRMWTDGSGCRLDTFGHLTDAFIVLDTGIEFLTDGVSASHPFIIRRPFIKPLVIVTRRDTRFDSVSTCCRTYSSTFDMVTSTTVTGTETIFAKTDSTHGSVSINSADGATIPTWLTIHHRHDVIKTATVILGQLTTIATLHEIKT